MIKLFINYYNDKDTSRRAEIDYCVQQNIENPNIDKIYVVLDSNTTWPFKRNKKVKRIKMDNRPTYREMFTLMNENSSPKDCVILSNTDIYFNETIAAIKKIDLKKTCLALCRWEEDEQGNVTPFNRRDSQDCWIFQGKIKIPTECDFTTGILGCDNRIAFLLANAGYKVFNPCNDIQAIHKHTTEVRNYSSNDRVEPPYMHLDCGTIMDVIKGDVKEIEEIFPPRGGTQMEDTSRLPGPPVKKLFVPAEEKQNSTVDQRPELVRYYANLKDTVDNSPKRVLHIALNDPAAKDPQRALKNALKSLGEYREIDWIKLRDTQGIPAMRQAIINANKEFKPDLTFMQIQNPDALDASTVKALDGFVMNWTGDVRQPTPQWFFEIGKHINVTCFTNMDDVNALRNDGLNAEYLQIGYDNHIFMPVGEQGGYPDIVFMGNNYSNGFPLSGFRKDMVHRLKQKYFALFRPFGTGWDASVEPQNLMYNEQAEASCYRSCKIAINVSHFDLDRYSSDRIFRIMGSGAFCLSKYYPGIEKEFKIGTHLDVFNSMDELMQKIDFYLDSEVLRQQIARQGQELVANNYTWEHRMLDVKNICGWKK